MAFGDLYIPALADGTAAADGSAITNPPGYYNNGFEGTITETDFKLIDFISISGGDTATLPYDTIVSTKPSWVLTTSSLEWDGANFIYDNGTETWTHATATGTFPDKTGWPVGSLGSAAIVLAYDSYFVENGEFAARTYADDLARINLDQKVVDQWKKVGGVCLLAERLVYSQSLVQTLSWYNRAIGWAHTYTDECGAGSLLLAEDVNNEQAIDVNEDYALAL